VTTTSYIASITLDESGIARRTAQVSHDRNVAMNDITEWNHFAVRDMEGPYRVTLGTAENRVTLTIESDGAQSSQQLGVPLAPFRGIIRDYVMICESYFEAVRHGNIPKIEAIDMSRRGLHNEGADMLSTLLEDKVQMDSETARRLFTLLHVLQLK
jgi:uncharacterized protein (UPF0262 family)